MLQTAIPGGSLHVVANSANNMRDIETIGKQDPYLRFALNLNDKKTWQSTFAQKGAGQNATWNQSFQVPFRGEPDLFVEVLDKEITFDKVIGFCAIPVAQVVQSPGGFMDGVFALYNFKSENNGTVHLTLTVYGFNSPPGGAPPSPPVFGRSYVNEGHRERLKSRRKKAIAGDVGIAVGVGALLAGAAYLGKKAYDNHQQRKEQRERDAYYEMQQQEAERQRLSLQQHHNTMASNWDSHGHIMDQYDRQEDSNYSSPSPSPSSPSGSHGDDEKHKYQHSHRVSDWNPVGNYQPGDLVAYQSRTYVCLQSHTSNPTWPPAAAHGLWQPS
ncbi:hypothetical protein BX666DRAFT_2021338 [Dichotomocladium elegans]|nr:hypothetical protein BX666DRAFT_2021338 [Dichotomocladium elegans]